MTAPKPDFVPPEWSIELDEDGMVKTIMYNGVVVGRVTHASLSASTESIFPTLRLEITGPVKITVVEGACARESIDADGNSKWVTASPTKVTNL
jgi:hypothetical protein